MLSKQSQALASELEVCPYDKNHKVGHSRFTNHLSKCRREYKARCELDGKPIDMFICKHNYLHQVLKPEVCYHEDRCEDRKSLRNYQLNLAPIGEFLGESGVDWSQYDFKKFRSDEKDRNAMYGGLELGMVDGADTYGESVNVKKLMSMTVEEIAARVRALSGKYSAFRQRMDWKNAMEEAEKRAQGEGACGGEDEPKSKDKPAGAAGGGEEDWGKECTGRTFDYFENIWHRTKRQMHTPIPMGLSKTEKKLYMKKYGKQMEEERKLLVAVEAEKTAQMKKNNQQWQSDYETPFNPKPETKEEEEKPGFRDGDFEFY